MGKTYIAKIGSRLGESLIAEGLLTQNQLRYAIEIQHKSINRKRLGDILVELGYVTKRQLRDVSRKYDFRLQMGSLLVDSGWISESQLQQALETQKHSRKRLGEILVEEQAVTEEELGQAISQHLDFPYIIPNKRLVDRRLLDLFPERLLKQHLVLPLFRVEETVTVLVHDPFDPDIQQMLKAVLGDKFELAIGARNLIRNVLHELLDETSLMAEPPSAAGRKIEAVVFERYDLDEESPAGSSTSQMTKIVDYLIANAIAERASDIHIESMYNRIRVRYRIDGTLYFKTDLPRGLAEGVVRRIRVLAKMDLSSRGVEAEDGHIYVKSGNNNIDLRVSLYPTVLGSSVTMRVLTKELGLKDLYDLGMLPKALAMLREFFDSPSGLTLFSGPTGSGKTTSLYASLNYLNENDHKICTLEAPVEYSIEGVAQGQMKSSSEDFIQEMLKAMMHQDPDVIVFGEILNEATAAAAVQAALSGHKVFSTIHTDDAIGAVFKLLDLGLRAYLLASTGLVTLSQRLVRTICASCRKPQMPSRDLLMQFRLQGIDPDECEFFRGAGCTRCNHTGYYQRTGIFEMLGMNDEVRNAFLAKDNASSIRALAKEARLFISLREAGFIKAFQGQTTLDEAYDVLSYSEKQVSAGTHLTKDTIAYWTATDNEKTTE